MSRLVGWICALLVMAGTLLAMPAAAGAEGPSGFMPSSTSWLNDDKGFVVGFVPNGVDWRTVLLRTIDGGATWHPINTPQLPLVSVDRRVRVRFANARDGVITDGQAMYATHTGGLLWRRVDLPGAGPAFDIGELASNDRTLYAIVSNDNTTRLFATPLAVDRWAPVPGVELAGRGRGTVVAGGDGAYVALNLIHESIGYWSTANGRTWRPSEPPCTIDGNPELGLTSGATVFALCSFNPGRGSMFKDVLKSVAGGPFTLVSQAPEPGITTDFAVASPSRMAIAAVGVGAAWLHLGTQGGTVWETPFVTDEPPFSDLAFTSERNGVLVWGGPLWGQAAVYRTTDGGTTWTAVDFD
jgi:photosystem II stability/assembly factor-like uncharacterized protein